MSPGPIGQTIVTDPAVSGTGGYMLVAASPSVSAEDREHLAAMPQVSDYLHLETSPRVFFSFYRLPSGAWAFAQRFARGKRRGSLNRIVAHTLVLSEETLDDLAWEPRLLSNCAFRAGGSGEPKSFASLKEWDGDSVPRTLDDLGLIPPPDADAQRFDLLTLRRKFLSESGFGEEGFERTLARALAGCGAERGLLLGQTPEDEQLLALAWAALPRHDRRETPWTTHLAPGSASLFRLANVPGAEEARAAGASDWSALGEAGGGSAVIAKSLVTDQPPWLQVASRWYESLDKDGLSLIHNEAQVRRWVIWLEHGGAPAGGLPALKDLKAYLDSRSIDSTAVADPWERPEELLRLSAATLRNLKRGRSGAKPAGEVLEALEDRGLSDVLLQPERFAELAERGEEIEADTLLAALDLALRHAASDPARQAALLLSALAAAKGREDPGLAGRVAAEYVVPQGAALSHLSVADVESVLEALRAAPEGLAEALLQWPDDLADRAARALGRWAQSDPKAALLAAAPLASRDDIEVRELPSLRGLSASLAQAGASEDGWLPFALAEAAAIDGGGEEKDAKRFAAFLSFLQISPEKSRPAASILCRRLQRTDLVFGAAHRALVAALSPSLAMRPAEAVAAFGQVRLTEDELRLWWEPFGQVADALGRQNRRAEASQVRRIWWIGLATLPWQGYAREALGLFDGLSESDRKEVAGIWVGKLAQLPDRPGDEALVQELRKRIAADPKHQLELEIQEVRARIPRIGLTRATADLAVKLRFSEKGELTLGNILAEELRRNPEGKMRAIFDLLLTPGLLPSTRRLVEQRFFEGALKNANERLFLVVLALPVATLARRGSLLLQVSYRLGALSPKAPYDAYEFLQEAVKLGRFDAVGAFLRGAGSVKYKFFDHLVSKDGNLELASALKRAAQNAVYRWDLMLFLPEINALSLRGS